MINDIIKLVDLSIEDGKISDDDYKVILEKCLRSNITEDELRLIIAKRIRPSLIKAEKLMVQEQQKKEEEKIERNVQSTIIIIFLVVFLPVAYLMNSFGMSVLTIIIFGGISFAVVIGATGGKGM